MKARMLQEPTPEGHGTNVEQTLYSYTTPINGNKWYTSVIVHLQFIVIHFMVINGKYTIIDIMLILGNRYRGNKLHYQQRYYTKKSMVINYIHSL